jgi:hypothetical protein
MQLGPQRATGLGRQMAMYMLQARVPQVLQQRLLLPQQPSWQWQQVQTMHASARTSMLVARLELVVLCSGRSTSRWAQGVASLVHACAVSAGGPWNIDLNCILDRSIVTSMAQATMCASTAVLCMPVPTRTAAPAAATQNDRTNNEERQRRAEAKRREEEAKRKAELEERQRLREERAKKAGMAAKVPAKPAGGDAARAKGAAGRLGKVNAAGCWACVLTLG